MSPRSSRNPIILDWFNVTYRSVILSVLTVVVLVGGAGAWWYWASRVEPRRDAERAIGQAEVLLARAKQVTGDPVADEMKASSEAALREARSRFGVAEYHDARTQAFRSSDLSRQVLDRVRGDDDGPERARLLRSAGDVKVKLAGEFAWSPVTPQMKLSVGDQIKTSSGGSAVLLYFDGTKTTIKPGSLLEIRALVQDPVTGVRRVRERLGWGVLEASTRKPDVKGSYHEVATDSAVARAEDEGEYRVEQTKGERRASFSTFTGAAIEIATGERKAMLAEGERIVARGDGSLSAKDLLPGVPRQIAPEDRRIEVVDSDAGTEMTLRWEVVPGAARYHLLIAADSLFVDVLYDAQRTETRVPVEVGPGEYFWKVAAVNAAGLEGRFSDTRQFRVTNQRIRDQSDTTPPDLAVHDKVLTGSMLIVTGATEPGATLWIDDEKQEIDESGAFSTVVRLRRSGWNDIELVAQDAAGNEARVTERVYLDEF